MGVRGVQKRSTKYIFVTGGVLSSLGKGLASASMGALLEARGLRVAFLKLDPYLNVDPGTMNPFQHGEVYVTEDGAETDLDLGHVSVGSGPALGRVQTLDFTGGAKNEAPATFDLTFENAGFYAAFGCIRGIAKAIRKR